MSAKFIFDDHIRCMVARKRLEKGRERAHELKLQEIALWVNILSFAVWWNCLREIKVMSTEFVLLGFDRIRRCEALD